MREMEPRTCGTALMVNSGEPRVPPDSSKIFATLLWTRSTHHTKHKTTGQLITHHHSIEQEMRARAAAALTCSDGRGRAARRTAECFQSGRRH